MSTYGAVLRLNDGACDVTRSGVIDQDCRCVGHLTLAEDITLVDRLRGTPQIWTGCGTWRPGSVSTACSIDGPIDAVAANGGGAVIARALYGRPRVLLADEPTAHIDGESIGPVIDRLLAEAGSATVVVVSHDPLVAARFDDRRELVEVACRDRACLAIPGRASLESVGVLILTLVLVVAVPVHSTAVPPGACPVARSFCRAASGGRLARGGLGWS